MALYRNRDTHEIVDAIAFMDDAGNMIVKYVVCDMNPPRAVTNTLTPFHKQFEKVPPPDEKPAREIHLHFPNDLSSTYAVINALKDRSII